MRSQGSGLNSACTSSAESAASGHCFTANRYITNGLIRAFPAYICGRGCPPEVVIPRELYAVGEAVEQLGDILPRRKYVLIGQTLGKQGRHQIGGKSYLFIISGTAALLKWRGKAFLRTRLSFGTHFFRIWWSRASFISPSIGRDEWWKEGFFKGNHNLLGTVLPDFAWLSDVIKVIDVPGSCFGRTLSIHMNSDQERAVAFLTESNPEAGISQESSNAEQMFNRAPGDQGHWKWRHYMAQQIADALDMEALNVKGAYLIGSSNTGDGMGSDIDLICT